MELITVKLIAAVSLWTLTLLCALIPILIRMYTRREGSRRLLSLLNCVGGGVFLGTCFLHLLPEVQEQMTNVFKLLNIKQTYPVSEFLLTVGFLTILLIEQIILLYQEQDNEETAILHNHHHHGQDHPTYGAITEDRLSDQTHSIHADHRSHSSLRTVVLVLALSLHSLFEGLAIGLEQTVESVMRVLIAIFIHKSVIAFTLGLNLIHSRLRKPAIIWSIGTFVSMSPLGAVIGSIITGVSHGLTLFVVSGILQGMAAGTFIYVTFFEILPHELNSMFDKLWKLLCLVLGFSFSCILILLVPG